MMATRSIIFILLFMASTSVWAAETQKKCVRGEFCADLNRANQLLQILEKGVEQCYNKNQKRAIQETQIRLTNIENEIRAAAIDWTSNKKKIVDDAATLANELSSLDKSPGFPADLYCGTNRKCLEIGFEGNKRYPNCLPVGDNIHGNVQYLSLEDFFNTALPKLAALLDREANKIAMTQAANRKKGVL